jgi:hypothetical protein
MGAMLFQNVIGKNDQPIVYAYRLLNKVEHNYSTTHKKALTLVCFAQVHTLFDGQYFCLLCRSYGIDLFGQQTTSYRENARLLLSFLEYDFTIVYKLGRIHVVAYALSRLLDIIEPTRVFDQTRNVSLFYIEPKWLNDVKEFLRT